ncbi:unnamed protein product [Rhizoctonia solani]|uniref:Uncharacterized protein n=1 Tax=Rhizoctonia solani TaxID=456999 RepID=A0A8H2WUC6_9AGAM|nr:unnamed protein product [Rhizoctonia solani]
MYADCFGKCVHGGLMHNINARLRYGGPRILVGMPVQASTDDQHIPSGFAISPSPKPSLHNWFVPPTFCLYSEYAYDPKIKMERTEKYEPFKDVQATVFAWSGYNESKCRISTFTPAFTSAVLEAKGDMSNGQLCEEVRQRAAEDGIDEAPRMLNDPFAM